MKRRPIFIGGLAHSGKTPLRQMLGRHPRLALTRRTYMWPRYYGRFGDLAQADNLERCLNAMLADKHVQALEPDPIRIRHAFRVGEPTYARLFAIIHEHHAEKAGKQRWGDQLGVSVQYADDIFAAYPGARIIHMIRDPRRQYESTASLSTIRPGKVGWTTARWLHSAKTAARNCAQYPGGYRIVHYEALISQPESTLQEICAFLEETFDPAMLTAPMPSDGAAKVGGKAATVGTSGTAASSNGNSQGVMSSGEVTFMQHATRQALYDLGYAPSMTEMNLQDHFRYYLYDGPINRAGMVAWQLLQARKTKIVTVSNK